jgi:hypothetical protein
MTKIVGTRERVHPAFYESLERGLGPYREPARPRPLAVTPRWIAECRNCGAPRRDAMTCDYCERAYA